MRQVRDALAAVLDQATLAEVCSARNAESLTYDI